MVAAAGARSSQLLRGVLDVCLLALISEEERYGYELIKQLEGRGLEVVGEGSIYPLLSRLQRARLIEGFSVPSNGGPPRKYYRITPEGRRARDAWVAEWESFSHGVDRVLGGGR
jgi:PadR family transcriptional regulator, regulatory protein PadR